MKFQMTVIGNVGKDAIVNEVSGKKVINFNVASTRSYKNKEGKIVEKTDWVECSDWRGRNIASYLLKGKQVEIIGEPFIKEYEKDGKHYSKFSLKVLELLLLGGKAQEPKDKAGIEENVAVNSAELVENLPF